MLPEDTIWITKDAVTDIDADILAYRPERGGALLGPAGAPTVITRFVADPSAQVTGVSYTPSRWLVEEVPVLEQRERLELRGILHSHPGHFDRPSTQDVSEFATGLRLNPHLERYLGPIATHQASSGTPAPHELHTARGKVTWYAAYRASKESIELRPIPVVLLTKQDLDRLLPTLMKEPRPMREIPLRHDLERVAAALGITSQPELFLTTLEGVAIPAGCLVLQENMELLVLASESYPVTPPAILATIQGSTENLPLDWDLTVPAKDRLVTSLNKHFLGLRPYRKVYGPSPSLPLAHDPARAAVAGWPGVFSGQDPQQQCTMLATALRARSTGLLATLEHRTVGIIGLGSVGSFMAVSLVRQGVGHLIGIDPDEVEPENLSRTIYDVADIRSLKTAALGKHLLNANPSLDYEPLSVAVQNLDSKAFDEIARRVNLFIAASDDPAAQRLVNRYAYARGVPAVFVGLYAGAKGGEIIITYPERTACYQCATSVRHTLESEGEKVSRQVDYGTGRLAGEVALASDIHYVACAAVKVGLSLLLQNTDAKLKGFLDPLLESGGTYLTFSMEPRYWFYPHLFETVPGQFAYQSVCITPERRDNCPICGPREGREEPTQLAMRRPRLADVQAVVKVIEASCPNSQEETHTAPRS